MNYAGLALIVFGVVLLLLEIKVVSHGMLAIGGIAALLIGSLMLIRPGSGLEVMRISRTLIISTVAVTSGFFLFVIGMGLKAQRRKPVTGMEAMVGETAVAFDDAQSFREGQDTRGDLECYIHFRNDASGRKTACEGSQKPDPLC